MRRLAVNLVAAALFLSSAAFAGGYSPFGYQTWKAPVASQAALPASGNTPGDARIDLTDFDAWIWTGSGWEQLLVGATGATGAIGPTGSTGAVGPTGNAGVTSVSNSDSSLVVTPTTGAVVASINTAHSNTFSASQAFDGGVDLGGYGMSNSGPIINPNSGANNGWSIGNQSGARLLIFQNGNNSIYEVYRSNNASAGELYYSGGNAFDIENEISNQTLLLFDNGGVGIGGPTDYNPSHLGNYPLQVNAANTIVTVGGASTASLSVAGQIYSTAGSPTIASNACGSSTQGTVSGTNQSGLVTVGTAAVTTCTISFSATLSTAPNACLLFPSNATAAATSTTVASVSSISTSQFVITGTALASAAYYFICL